MADSLCESLEIYRYWNYSSGDLNHRAIVLQIVVDRYFIVYPFNFNPTWLVEEEFEDMVQNKWIGYDANSRETSF